nr:hypothetical protein BaRGS_016255 [Batillaria attramentaria]
MFRLLEEITGCGISPILLLVGVSTNIVNCLVFYRQGLKERMNLCLFSLALIDMAFVVVFFLMHLNCLVAHFSPEAGQWWFYFTSKYLVGFHAGFLLSSGCLITIIAVDRCLCVTMPLKAATLVNTRTMAVIIVVIVIVVHAGCSLLPFSTDVVAMSHPVTGATVFILTYTRFYLDNKVLLKILIDVVLRIAIPFTSFAVVTAATAITVIQLKRAITWRATTGSGSDDNNVRQKSLAKMLVIVSCVFIVTAAPGVVLGLVSFTMPNIIPSGDDGNTYATAFLVYQVFTMVNSSVNFFIYVTRSARFRNMLRSFFVDQSAKSRQVTSEASADQSRPRRVGAVPYGSA